MEKLVVLMHLHSQYLASILAAKLVAVHEQAIGQKKVWVAPKLQLLIVYGRVFAMSLDTFVQDA